jgi:beta-glucosidase/6-phospho-beta-glucosidase/beta-galactosidase
VSVEFPKGFRWGAASSSYQTEGAVHEEGRRSLAAVRAGLHSFQRLGRGRGTPRTESQQQPLNRPFAQAYRAF